MKLFEPITIRGMELKNRIVLLPMGIWGTGHRGWGIGYRSRSARAYYVERARGGAAAITTSAASVDLLISDDAWEQPGGADNFVGGLRQLTKEVHEAGAKIGMQLGYANRYPAGRGDFGLTVGMDTRGDPVAPSAREGYRELTVAEIESIIASYAAASARCREAEFDFVEVHGAHTYLPCQFFSPLENRRSDKYGGDLRRRMRFGIECVQAMKRSTGDDYPLFFRIGAQDSRPGGTTLEDAIEYARELEKAGADVLSVSIVSIGDRGGRQASPGRKQPMATFVPLAEAIKKNVSVPVIGAGRINTPEIAEDILVKGRVDLVGIGRQLICDPFWPKKVLEGRVSEIVACDSCNANCSPPLPGRKKLKPGAPICKFNHRVGREWEIPPPE